jgi:hypothetical protein
MRIDFDSFIAERTRDFSARTWIVRRVAEWLADPAAPRFFLITGEPGSGKTAILARLCELSSGTESEELRLAGSIAAHHFCSAQDSHWLDPVRFSESISTQLADRIPRFREMVVAQLREQRPIEIHAQIGVAQNWGNVIAVNVSAALTAGEAFSRVVRSPLEALYAAAFDRPIVIAVDALDEARHASAATNIFHLVARSRYLPPQVRFVLTSRPVGEIVRELEQQTLTHVALGDPSTHVETLADVRRYVKSVVAAQPELVARRVPQLAADALIDRICAKSDGNFLWARYALLTLQSGGVEVDDVAVSALPAGLDRLYVEFLHRVVEGSVARWRDELGPTLGLLAVSQEELTEEEIASLTSLPRDVVAQDLRLVSELLETTGNRYRIFHRSFVDFLLTPSTAHEYWCDASAQHRRIVARWREHRRGSDYELRNVARHLFELGDDEEAARDLDALVSREWMEHKRTRLGSDASFFTDVELALESARRRRPAAIAQEVKASLVLATLGSRGERLGAPVMRLLTRLGRFDEALQHIRIMPPSLRSRAYAAVSDALLKNGDAERALDMAREALSAAPAEDERGEARAALVAALAHAGRLDEAFAMAHQVCAWNVLEDLRTRVLGSGRFDLAAPLLRSIESRGDRVRALAGVILGGGLADVDRYKDLVAPDEIDDAIRDAVITAIEQNDFPAAVAIASVRGDDALRWTHLQQVCHLALKDLDELRRFVQSGAVDAATAWLHAARVLAPHDLDRALAMMRGISSPEIRRSVRTELLNARLGGFAWLECQSVIDTAESREEKYLLPMQVFEAAVKRGDVATALRFYPTFETQLLWIRLLSAAEMFPEVHKEWFRVGNREASLFVVEALARAGDVDAASDLASRMWTKKREAIARIFFGAAAHSTAAVGGVREDASLAAYEFARLIVSRPRDAQRVIQNFGDAARDSLAIGNAIHDVATNLFEFGADALGEALLPHISIQVAPHMASTYDWDFFDPAHDRLRIALERVFDAQDVPRSALLAARRGDVVGALEAMSTLLLEERSVNGLIDVLLASVALGRPVAVPRLLENLRDGMVHARPAIIALAAAGFEDAVRERFHDAELREQWIVDGLILAGRREEALALLDTITPQFDVVFEITDRYARIVAPEELPRRVERLRSPEVYWSIVLSSLCRNHLVEHAVALVPFVEDTDWPTIEHLDFDPRALASMALAIATPHLRGEVFAAALERAAEREMLPDVLKMADGDLLDGVSGLLENTPEASAVVELERGESRDYRRFANALTCIVALGKQEQALQLAASADGEGFPQATAVVLAAIARRSGADAMLPYAKNRLAVLDAAMTLAQERRFDLAIEIASKFEIGADAIANLADACIENGVMDHALRLAESSQNALEQRSILALVAHRQIQRGDVDGATETLRKIPRWLAAPEIVTAAAILIESGNAGKAAELPRELFAIGELASAATIGELVLDAGDETGARKILDDVLLKAGAQPESWSGMPVLENALTHLAANGDIETATALEERFRRSRDWRRGRLGILRGLEARGDVAGASQIAWSAFEDSLAHVPAGGTVFLASLAIDVARLGPRGAIVPVAERIFEMRPRHDAIDIFARLAAVWDPGRRSWLDRFRGRRRANALLRRAKKMAEDLEGHDRLIAMASLVVPLAKRGRRREALRIANALLAARDQFDAQEWVQRVLPKIGRAFAEVGQPDRARDIVRELMKHRTTDRQIAGLLPLVADAALCDEIAEHIAAAKHAPDEYTRRLGNQPVVAAMFAAALRKRAASFSPRGLAAALLACAEATRDDELVVAARAAIDATDAGERLELLSTGAMQLHARDWARAARMPAADPEIPMRLRALAHARLAHAFHAFGDARAAEEALWKCVDALRHLSRDEWYVPFEIARPLFERLGTDVMTAIYVAITDVETWSL